MHPPKSALTLIQTLRQTLDRSRASRTVDAEVERRLMRSLHRKPAALAVGALTNLSATAALVYLAQSTVLTFLFVVLFSIAVILAALNRILRRSRESSTTPYIDGAYHVMALAYSAVLGVVAAVTLLSDLAATLKIVMTANALCFGVGICARNAGRPSLAIGELALVSLPIAVVSVASGDPAMVVLACNIVMLGVAMVLVTLDVNAVLRRSIGQTRDSEINADKMRVLARTDAVTALMNRAGLNQNLVDRMAQLEDGENLALFWIDLDRFKEVNDLFGHPVGDRVLQLTAERLCDAAPAHASVARFGGDEFIVLCHIEDKAEAVRLSSELHALLMQPMQVQGERLEVGASIGIAVMPDDGQDADTLMQNADLALYEAKSNGRKRSCFYVEAMSRDLVYRREIEAELRAAIVNDELSLFYQPIVDLKTGRVRAVEALVRWFHPEKGELLPDEFIPLAEETGVILTLGNWITARAARDAMQWPADIMVSVNLSPLQIKAPGASLGVLNALRRAGLPAERLEVEVTESLFLTDHAATEAFITDLTEAGVRFALDDFGTGYSSLGYIHKYPFTKIKVDRSFVSGPDINSKSNAIIWAVAELGAKLGMEIVAEGIETAEQVARVQAAGCTMGQGYHFSRPVPPYLINTLIQAGCFDPADDMLRIA